MTDKTSVPEVGSKENPLGPTPEQAAPKWTKKLRMGADPRTEKFLEDVAKLGPTLEIAEKLGNHTSSIMVAVRLMQRQDSTPEKINLLLSRLRPVLALKEDLDLYVSESCEMLLDGLERGDY